MPELEMCPHCSIALVDCEYHGPKARREAPGLTFTAELAPGSFSNVQGPQTVEDVVTQIQANIRQAVDDILKADPRAPPEPDRTGCSCWKTWRIHDGLEYTLKERVIERVNPRCAVHGQRPAEEPRPEHVAPFSGTRYRWANDEHMTVLNPTSCSCGAPFVIGFALGPNDGTETRWRCMKCQPR